MGHLVRNMIVEFVTILVFCKDNAVALGRLTRTSRLRFHRKCRRPMLIEVGTVRNRHDSEIQNATVIDTTLQVKIPQQWKQYHNHQHQWKKQEVRLIQ